jgi:thioesterase domain-containing protein
MMLFVAGNDHSPDIAERWAPCLNSGLAIHLIDKRHSEMADAAALAQIGSIIADKLSRTNS